MWERVRALFVNEEVAAPVSPKRKAPHVACLHSEAQSSLPPQVTYEVCANCGGGKAIADQLFYDAYNLQVPYLVGGCQQGWRGQCLQG